MRIFATADTNSHHTNPYYQTLIVEWSRSDPNFQFRNGKPTWVPTTEEAVKFVAGELMVNKEFLPVLARVINEKTPYRLVKSLEQFV